MDENIKSLMKIANALEVFKLKAYELLNKEKWFDDFVMNNAPCNYNLDVLIKKIQMEVITHKVTPCHDSMFHEFPCLEDENRYGFFKSQADIRPSSCTWVDKKNAEKLYKLFKTGA